MYESLPFGREAVRLYRKLVSDSSGQVPFSLSLWRMDLLMQEEAEEAALIEASEASLLILSVPVEFPPLPRIEEFFHRAVLGRESKGCAIVGLMDGAGEGGEAADASLLGRTKVWAQEAGLQYFEQRIHLPASDYASSSGPTVYSPWLRRQMELLKDPPCDYPGFGIND